MLDSVLKSTAHTSVCFEQAVANPSSLFATLAQTFKGIIDVIALRKVLSSIEIKLSRSYIITNCSNYTFLTHMLKGNKASCSVN